MLIAKILASIGLLAIAGLCGVGLGILEKKFMEGKNVKTDRYYRE